MKVVCNVVGQVAGSGTARRMGARRNSVEAEQSGHARDLDQRSKMEEVLRCGTTSRRLIEVAQSPPLYRNGEEISPRERPSGRPLIV